MIKVYPILDECQGGWPIVPLLNKFNARFRSTVRHQQTSLRTATDRLKVVDKLPISGNNPTTDGRNLSTLFFNFVGGLSGSIIGTGLIFYLTAKDLIHFKMLF